MQVDLSERRETKMVLVGLAGKSTRECRERVRSAIVHSGFRFPIETILVNLAPASQEKDGAGFDLPIAIGILLACGALRPRGGSRATGERLSELAFVGELGFEGEVRPVRGAVLVADALARRGIRELVVPAENAAEVALLEGLSVYPAGHLRDAVDVLLGGGEVEPVARQAPSAPRQVEDFVEVRGQEATKRGVLIAAAGGHNILMSGPPGVGKTMLARRLPGILPPLSTEAAMEVLRVESSIGSAAGRRLERVPPFRAPHHTISYAGLVGGGAWLVPGEVTRAHRGVLFLDELPEFPRRVLEALREPIEAGEITIGRARGACTFPADFLLVAAMNPCPCGYRGHPRRRCRCTPRQVASYCGRISGPLYDRIDVFVRVSPVDSLDLLDRRRSDASLDSETMARQVERVRVVQARRWPSNRPNRVSLRELLERGRVRDGALSSLRAHAERLELSARGFARTLRVARTIADLEGDEQVTAEHVLEAFLFRAPDAT